MFPTLLALAAACAADQEAVSAGEQNRPAVGVIFVVGNRATRDYLYVERLGLAQGSVLKPGDIRKAQRRLVLLCLLGVTCSVQPLDRECGTQYTDILVRVREGPVARLLGPVHHAIRSGLEMLRGK
jgi:hypothetical protein